MMATVQLTKENLDEVLSSNDMVLIDFWASWCGPCQVFGPIFEAASERHPDIVFAKVDTEAQQELARSFGIRSIPMLMIVRAQVVVYAQPGAVPGEALEELVDRTLKLDMDEVDRQMEAHLATQGAS
jgi:thioredoxin 1